MSIKDEFMNEVEVGKYVELTVNRLPPMKGTVISVDEEVVRIQDADGQIRVAHANKVAFYTFADSSKRSERPDEQELIEPVKDDFVQEENEDFFKYGSVHTISEKNIPAPQLDLESDIIKHLEERGERYFSHMHRPSAAGYRETAKKIKNNAGGRELWTIAERLDDAFHSLDNPSPEDSKIRTGAAKLKRLAKLSAWPENRKAAANMLAALYVRCACETLALETYKRDGDDYISAFAVAEKAKQDGYMRLFASRHFIYDEQLNPYIVYALLCCMIRNTDYSLLTKIDVHHAAEGSLAGRMALVKGILLYHGISYPADIDRSCSAESLTKLLKLFRSQEIKTNMGMLNDLPTDFLGRQEEPSEEECPTYIDARKAWEEKHYTRAEALYISAINKKERPHAAAADLVGLMIERRLWTRASEYLVQYGLRYMEKGTYERLKQKIVRANSYYGEKISEYEKKFEEDYCLLAQKADREDQDPRKAIALYQEAIKKWQKPSMSVSGLASLYARLQMYSEALVLLKKHGRDALGNKKALNLRLSILHKAKDPAYKKDTMDTYEQLIARRDIPEDGKADLFFAEADLLTQMGEHREAINCFLQALQRIEQGCYTEENKAFKQRLNALMGICRASFRLDDLDTAKTYADQILLLQPENELALSVIKGGAYAELFLGKEKISSYILQKLDWIQLEQELKNITQINNGVFTGTEEECRRIIDQKIIDEPDEGQYTDYFIAAKLIRQMLDSGREIRDSNFFNEENYRAYLAMGSYLYGNTSLYFNDLEDASDTARYCYAASCSALQNEKSGFAIWAAATVRSIQTYFYKKGDIYKKSRDLYSALKKNSNRNAYVHEIKKAFHHDIRTTIEQFTAGMLELTTHNPKTRTLILNQLQDHSQYKRIFAVVSHIAGEEAACMTDCDDLDELWSSAAKNYDAMRSDFLRMLGDMTKDIFTTGQMEKWHEKFSDHKFLPYLNQTDTIYAAELRRIVSVLRRYNEIPDFDRKAELLSDADEIGRRFEDKIEKCPTALSYDGILPTLTRLHDKIGEEAGQLYGNAAPNIAVVCSGNCSVDEQNLLVRVPIAFTNRKNVQAADNVSIEISSDNADAVWDEQLVKGFLPGNGNAMEKIIAFKISQEVLQNKAFTAEICIQYQYKKNMIETMEGAQSAVLSIPLYSEIEFQPIDNKFEPYRSGSVVKEASMFYGREHDIEEIVRQISDESGTIWRGRCLALYGQTRTGKSSLLYHLERRLREINPEGNVIVNIGSIGEADLTGDNITEFLFTILDELSHEIHSRHPQLRAQMQNAGMEIDADRLLDEPERAQLYFNAAFRNLNRLLEESEQRYNIIIMIDEFTYLYDWIRRGVMTDRIMKFWKAFIQNQGVFAIIIGQDHMMKFVNEKQFTNDFGSTELRRVTYLPEESAKKLMDEPIQMRDVNGGAVSRYKPEALDRLYELTAGSAFLIMNLCAGVVDYLNQAHATFITRAHIEDYLKKNLSSFEEARFFEPQYNDKSSINSDTSNIDNKRILHRIAQLSGKKEWAPISKVIGQENDWERLSALEERDVVIIQGRERCKIKVVLYKEWILEKYGMEESHA